MVLQKLSMMLVGLGLLLCGALLIYAPAGAQVLGGTAPGPAGPHPAAPVIGPGGTDGGSPTASATPLCGLGWRIVPSVTPDGFLNAVAATGANDVWAAGSLIEHWDGTGWSISSQSNSSVNGIAALTANDAWAVGSVDNAALQRTLVMHWDGANWHVVPSPNPSSHIDTLQGVAALGANDVWAVGYADQTILDTLILHWDGTNWTTIPSPNPGTAENELYGITARAPNDIWAVGEYDNGTGSQPLIMHWDGVMWNVVPSSSVGQASGLHGITATGPNNAWAVGFYNDANGQHALLEHWDGANWSVVPGPDPWLVSTLTDVSANGHDDVWAVGSYMSTTRLALAEHWDGNQWMIVSSAGASADDRFAGVVAISSSDVWAVGQAHTGTGEPLVERYNDPCVVPSPTPTATPTAPPASATPTASTPTATPCAIQFSDVHTSDYFYQPVLYLACHGVVSGYADGTFRPYANTTRSQMVKIVVLGFGLPSQTPAGGAYTFADVPPTHPFFAYVETAVAHGITGGYACGGPGEPCDQEHRRYFRPYVEVTRGQLAKIVMLGAGFPLIDPATATFADMPPGSAFYSYVETASCRGILSGYSCGEPGEPCDGQHRPYYRPGNNATRGQIAKIAYGAITNPGVCGTAGR